MKFVATSAAPNEGKLENTAVYIRAARASMHACMHACMSPRKSAEVAEVAADFSFSHRSSDQDYPEIAQNDADGLVT